MEGNYKYLCIDAFKNRDQEVYCFCSESKNIQNAALKPHIFPQHKCCIQLKNRENLDILIELVSFQTQVTDLRLQDKLGKQNFHENIKKIFEPVFDKIRNTCEDLTETMMLASKENNQAVLDLNEKFLEIMKAKRIYDSSLYCLFFT